MSPEWVTAIGTVGTFLVIAASAVAALLQLRHMRSGNQIAAYNECRETMDSADFSATLEFIRTELPARLQDPAVCEDIVRTGFRNEYAGIRAVANLFESMGLFVKTGMMDKHLACQLWSAIVLRTWDSLLPLTKLVRSRVGPAIWINFEYMAVLSKAYMERFPQGEYPRGVARASLDKPDVSGG